MPLPNCMGFDSGADGPPGRSARSARSAWSQKAFGSGDLGQKGGPADITDPHFSLPPETPQQQILELLKEHQAASSRLLFSHKGLLQAMEEQHRELCEQFQRLGSGNMPDGAAPGKLFGLTLTPDTEPWTQKTSERSASRAPTAKRRITSPAQSPHSASPGPKSKIQKAWGKQATAVRPLGTEAPFWQELRWKLGKKVDHPYFDLVMGIIIVSNFVCVFVHSELQGMSVADQIGLGDGSAPMNADQFFYRVEIAYCAIYFAELAARALFLKWRALCTLGSGLDACIVIMSCVDAWVLTPLAVSASGQGQTLLMARSFRLMRISRVLRAVKVFRFMSMFRELRVMLRSFMNSFMALIWSMLFVSFLVVAFGVLMVQLTHAFVEDESASIELRRWVYKEFGTATRSTWSIFECTFTTAWPAKARRLVFEVNPLFSIVWVIFVVVVNFATMRVIAALFLKHTLAVTNQDEERAAMEKTQKKEHFAARLREIFQRGDKLGDGVLHQWEFEEMMKDPEILGAFQKLELSVNEILTLYEILADRDGVTDYEEFLAGALKMKNTSRTLDIIEVQHEQLIVRRILESLHYDCKKFFHLFTGQDSPLPDCPNIHVSRFDKSPGAAPEEKAHNKYQHLKETAEQHGFQGSDFHQAFMDEGV